MPETYRFDITAETAGLRLDEFLASELGGLSRMRIASLIEGGACLVDGSPSRAGQRLEAGESVEIAILDDRPNAMTPEPLPLDIVYEDEQIIVVVKPAGMLVHPTKSVRTGTLANALAHHLNLESQNSNLRPAVRPGLAHRLDRATSGLMVVAKTARALTVLSRHFHRRLIEKRYAAIVHGVLAEDEATINAPIGRDPDGRPQWRVIEDGRAAETRLRVLKRGERVTLVELEPVTGRTNQLRIHCAHRGHPIVGDDLYNRGQGPGAGGQWQGSGFRGRGAGIDNNYAGDYEFDGQRIIDSQTLTPGPRPLTPARLCLHAWRLGFHHPAGGRWMVFASPMSVEMSGLLGDEGIAGF